jgi:hypothetical protein
MICLTRQASIAPQWLAQEETMTAATPVATAPAPDRLQAAVNDAARHLCDAETALHIARQAGVGSWISAAYDPLHEAVADHMAAVDALKVVTGPSRRPTVRPARLRPA